MLADRAALLTGRNHHTVGMRAISNFNTGFPHMRGRISDQATTMAEVLRGVGYATFMVGKWHLCPMEEASAAGPFDNWPLQRGFDRFYGFLDGETDQFTPDLTYDNHRIDPPRTPEEGYFLTEDLVDKTLEFINDSVSIRPDRPFFTYLALGATHAPHQAPAEYLARHRGRYDDGWDEARRRWFARQQELGVIPPGTDLAPRNPGVEPWDELPEAQRRLAARLQEAFAAFLEHTDDQIGRLVEGLERMELLDDTVIVLLSDNGASREGGPFGVLHEMKFFNFLFETPEEALRAPRRDRRATQPRQLPVGLGPGGQHALPLVQVEHARGWGPRAVHRALAEGDRRRRRDPPPVPLRHRHRPHRSTSWSGSRPPPPTAACRSFRSPAPRWRTPSTRLTPTSRAGTPCSTSR